VLHVSVIKMPTVTFVPMCGKMIINMFAHIDILLINTWMDGSWMDGWMFTAVSQTSVIRI